MKNLNARIPEELDRELEVAVAQGHAPTKQAAAILAINLWLKSIVNSDENPIPIKILENLQSSAPSEYPQGVASDTSLGKVLELTGGEFQWVEKVIRIFREGPEQAVVALQHNVDMFLLASDVLRGVYGAPRDPLPKAGGESETPEELVERAQQLMRRAEDIRRAARPNPQRVQGTGTSGDSLAEGKRLDRKRVGRRKPD